MRLALICFSGLSLISARNIVPDGLTLNNSEHLAFEGDILLSKRQANYLLKRDSRLKPPRSKRKTLSAWIKWPTTIHYVFHSDCPETIKQSVYAATDNFNKLTCLHFIDGMPNPLKQHLLVRHNHTGCHSHYGMVEVNNHSQDLFLGQGCEHWGIVSHEMMHSLGIMHEQNRDDRNLHIRVHEDQIADGLDYAFAHCSTKWPDHDCIAYVPYDFGSVMHYGKRVFTKGGQTITTHNKNYLNTIGGKITGPSFYDIKQLNTMYCNVKNPCDDISTTKPKVSFGSSCLVLHRQAKTRESAEATCKALGWNGHLVHATNEQIINFIYEKWKKFSTARYYLLWSGLRTHANQSVWYYTPTFEIAENILWAPGEPDYPTYKYEFCTTLIMKNQTKGKLADVRCDRRLHFICEYNMTEIGCTQCQHGGYPHPKNCKRCICPSGFAGKQCQTFEPGSPASCGGWLNAASDWQQIKTPGHPGALHSEQSCSWVLEAPHGKSVEFKVLSYGFWFGNPSGVGCYWNYLEIKYDDDLANSGARFCGAKAPTGTFRSKTERMVVLVRSNQYQCTGFKGEFRFV